MAVERKPFHGARAILMVDGKPVGWMTDVSGEAMFEQAQVKVAGSPKTQHIAIVGVDVTMSCGMVRILTTDPAAEGYLPTMDDDTLINWPSMTALIKDTQDKNKVVYKIIGLVPNRFGFQITARGLAANNMSWTGVELRQESEG